MTESFSVRARLFSASPVVPERTDPDLAPPASPLDPQVDALKKIAAVARAGRSAKALAK